MSQKFKKIYLHTTLTDLLDRSSPALNFDILGASIGQFAQAVSVKDEEENGSPNPIHKIQA
jgi:hypothetical protein